MNGCYRVKIRRINGTTGNILNYWKEMGYEAELSRNDIRYLRRVCEPNLVIYEKTVSEGCLVLEREFLPNEIALIRIQYVGEAETE